MSDERRGREWERKEEKDWGGFEAVCGRPPPAWAGDAAVGADWPRQLANNVRGGRNVLGDAMVSDVARRYSHPKGMD